MYTALFILCLASAALAAPVEEPLLPGALPAVTSSRFLPFREIANGRIISGKPANKGDYPHQFALYLTVSGGTSFCGGSLISPTYILTAAHCVQGVTAVTVRGGIVSLSDSAKVEASAKRAIAHEKYNGNTIQNDVALLELSTSIAKSSNVDIIPLSSSTLGNGVSVTVSGYGRTSDSSSSISQTLNYVSLTTITNAVCGQTYGTNIITSGIVCTKGTNTESTCNGDSGGPLVTGSKGNFQHVGIVSFGSSAGCAKGYPVAFTRTAYFRDWIKTNSGV